MITTRKELKATEALQANEGITSSDNRFILLLQDDGNLVLYDYDVRPSYDYSVQGKRRVLFDAKSQGKGATKAIMQADGNLVVSLVSSPTTVRWSSKTDHKGNETSILAVTDDGRAIITLAGSQIWESTNQKQWTIAQALKPLEADHVLTRDQFMVSPDLRFKFSIEHSNADLIVEDLILDRRIWHASSNFEGSLSDGSLHLYPDGNLIEWHAGSEELWSSHSNGKGDATSVFKIQDDGDAVVMCKGRVVWHSDSRRVWSIADGEVLRKNDTMISPSGQFELHVKPDCSLAVIDTRNNGKAVWESGVKVANGQALVLGNGSLIAYHGELRVWTGRDVTEPIAALSLQDDGVAILSAGATKLWASK